mmetsp:Transcript_22061/g.71006  ORF Transcript_22061/g.71006 Transcript_22061/m.71006 type:complete len:308 (+) Transcript_22061:942-1865(+)
MSAECEHSVFSALEECGAARRTDFVHFHSGVRDDSSIDVLQCTRTGIVALSTCSHISTAFYREHSVEYWKSDTLEAARAKCARDDQRRADMLQERVKGKAVLDIGCGAGGFARRIMGQASSVSVVEPSDPLRMSLGGEGGLHETYTTVADVPAASADMVTMFHVLEHMLHPLEELRHAYRALKPGGTIVVEVPHARDYLLALCPAFKAFTLWSQHLILHTRDSLRQFLEHVGFESVQIHGVQRYPLSNHIGWLVEGAPGGHERRQELNDPLLVAAYHSTLDRLDQTDTIIAIAHRPHGDLVLSSGAK